MINSPNTTDKTITLPDGRALGYAEYGNSAGKPIFHFHGWPGSRLETQLFAKAATKFDVRLIGV
ncbi:MAG: alpha/beta hydrolase, partial [Chloroflexi bacterium]|nr:alpha/beta hydrolase [Chloroflexota bacterium]